jgi:hypothetical protein
VTGCSFEKMNSGVISYGIQQHLHEQHLPEYLRASALVVMDNGHHRLRDSTLTDIALVVPGLGESAFGYHGMRVGGGTNTVRRNRIHNTGNSGIFVGETVLGGEERDLQFLRHGERWWRHLLGQRPEAW